MPKKVYSEIAARLDAIANCARSGNTEWENKHADAIEEICKNDMPHGSGFDSGVKLDFSKSSPKKLVFLAPFHHMNDGGYYCGWVDYTVIVTPSLSSGFDLRITGRDYNGAKEYFYQLFDECLNAEV
jgi:hypothetical protein